MNTCIFCDIASKASFAHIIYEDAYTMAFLDAYPQSRGHLQFIPKKHFRYIYDIPNIGTFFTTSQKIIRGIIPLLGADHVTLATFGREITHAHLWIVPQYKGQVHSKEGARSKGEALEEIAKMLRAGLHTEY